MSASEPLIVSLDEFAELAGVTSETMRGYLRDVGRDGSVPAWLIERGERGRAYKIEAEGALAWWRKLREDESAAEAARLEKLQQLRLDLVGEPGAGDGEPSLSGRQKKEEIDAAITGLKYRKLLGELVDKAAVQRVISAAAVDLRRQLQRVPAEYGIATGLDADQVRDLEARIERALDAFVDEVTAPGAFAE